MNYKSHIIDTNKKAYFDFHIEDKVEAGLVLKGCEVKSIRQRRVNLKESFARIIVNELWLFNCHITPYEQGSFSNELPTRDRKLLLHRQQIDKWIAKTQEKGFTIVPLKLYLSKNKVKIQLGLAKAKKMHDKRHSIKEKSIQRDIQRAVRK